MAEVVARPVAMMLTGPRDSAGAPNAADDASAVATIFTLAGVRVGVPIVAPEAMAAVDMAYVLLIVSKPIVCVEAMAGGLTLTTPAMSAITPNAAVEAIALGLIAWSPVDEAAA